jgi:hypothetical protein
MRSFHEIAVWSSSFSLSPLASAPGKLKLEFQPVKASAHGAEDLTGFQRELIGVSTYSNPAPQ